MTYIVYADVMLIWSILINFIVLCMSSKILNVSIRIKHTLFWSVLTGITSTAEYMLTINQNTFIHHILYAGIYISMTALYFETNTFKSILSSTCVILICMTVIYGIVNAVGGGIRNNLPRTAIVLIISIIPLLTVIGILKSKTAISENRYRLLLNIDEKAINTYGYLDSGNLLVDRLTGCPVVILDYRIMNEFLNDDAYKYILTYHNTGVFDYVMLGKICKLQFYPLPYRTISSDFSVMPAFKLTALTYTNIGKTFSNVVAGISRYKLKDKNDYQVLLNESLKPNREEYSND